MLIHKLKEIWQRRDLIYTFVARDLKVRYRGSVLGFLWSFLDPLINAAVLWVIFTFLFARGIENFAVFLLIGILPWNFFAASVSQGSRVIMDNGGLIKKIRLPREVFPVSTVLANLIHFFLAFLVLVLFLIIFRVPFNPGAWLFFPAVLLLATVFNLGATLFSSSVSVYFRDFPYIVESVLRVLYFATPIFYSPDFIPERFRTAYLLNPLASAITALRQIFLDGRIPNLLLLVLLASVSLVSLVGGYFVFSRLEKGFAEEV